MGDGGAGADAGDQGDGESDGKSAAGGDDGGLGIMSEQKTAASIRSEYERRERSLLENLREHAAKLRELLDWVNDHWGYEDGIYRFYHQSFKVFQLQSYTQYIVAELKAI